VRGNRSETTQRTEVWIPKGNSHKITRKKKIIRVDGFDPNVVGVHVKSANSVVVFGRRAGRTTVELLFEGADKTAEKIIVAVVTERQIGDLAPLTTPPRVVDHEPSTRGTRTSPPTPVALPNGPRPDLRIQEGILKIIERKKSVAKMTVGSTSIIEIIQCSATEIGIRALKPGTTDIMFWYNGEPKPERIIVEVFPAEQSGPLNGLQIQQGHIQVWKRDRKVVRIAIGSTSIIDITQYTPYEIGITGLKPGRTNIVFWYEGKDQSPITMAVEVLPAQPAPDVNPFSTTGSTKADTARRQIEQALKKTISIEMTDGTLKEALKQLHEAASVNIVIDTKLLEEEGISTDAKVSLHLSGVSLGSALKILLTPMNLTTVIEDEVLKVTSERGAEGKLFAVAYKVKDLIQTEYAGQAAFDSLIELITNVVKPDSWEEVGGRSTIRANSITSSLVVRQTQTVHNEIQQLFTALRKWSHVDAKPTKLKPDSLPNLSPFQSGVSRTTRKRSGMIPHPVKDPLERVISVTFDEDKLEDVLIRVASAVDLHLLIDWKAIEAEGVTKNSPVSIDLKHVMAKSVLKLILEPMKLGAVLEGESILKVTSLSQAKTQPPLRVYRVAHLLTDPKVDLKKLSEAIRQCVEPDTWDLVGGDGTLSPNEKTQSLVIRQTEATHQEIADLLEQLAVLRKSPGDTLRESPPQTLNRAKPSTTVPAKPLIDTAAPTNVPRAKR
jgi:hypothetical protein